MNDIKLRESKIEHFIDLLEKNDNRGLNSFFENVHNLAIFNEKFALSKENKIIVSEQGIDLCIFASMNKNFLKLSDKIILSLDLAHIKSNGINEYINKVDRNAEDLIKLIWKEANFGEVDKINPSNFEKKTVDYERYKGKELLSVLEKYNILDKIEGSYSSDVAKLFGRSLLISKDNISKVDLENRFNLKQDFKSNNKFIFVNGNDKYSIELKSENGFLKFNDIYKNDSKISLFLNKEKTTQFLNIFSKNIGNEERTRLKELNNKENTVTIVHSEIFGNNNKFDLSSELNILRTLSVYDNNVILQKAMAESSNSTSADKKAFSSKMELLRGEIFKISQIGENKTMEIMDKVKIFISECSPILSKMNFIFKGKSFVTGILMGAFIAYAFASTNIDKTQVKDIDVAYSSVFEKTEISKNKSLDLMSLKVLLENGASKNLIKDKVADLCDIKERPKEIKTIEAIISSLNKDNKVPDKIYSASLFKIIDIYNNKNFGIEKKEQAVFLINTLLKSYDKMKGKEGFIKEEMKTVLNETLFDNKIDISNNCKKVILLNSIKEMADTTNDDKIIDSLVDTGIIESYKKQYVADIFLNLDSAGTGITKEERDSILKDVYSALLDDKKENISIEEIQENSSNIREIAMKRENTYYKNEKE